MKNLFLLFAFISLSAVAQTVNPELLTKNWRAFWVYVPNTDPNDYGVYHFRKVLSLEAKPATYVVHVSADNRYKLFVNGQLVSLGPARGDLYHWHYETVDIAPYLQQGNNVVMATVWNDGKHKPLAQISSRTAFILQGDGKAESALNTNASWKCVHDTAYALVKPNAIGFFVAPYGEFIDMNKAVLNSESPEYNDSHWEKAATIGAGLPKGVNTMGANDWMLVPSAIPQMERTPQYGLKVRKTEGITLPKKMPVGKLNFTVPANTKATILLDQTFNTNAYPVLQYSGGKNATIALKYAEALYDNNYDKGNRDEIEGKKLHGVTDSLIANGKKQQTFTPLYWKTFRYLQLSVQTGSEPITIEQLYSLATGYPFQRATTFSSDDPQLTQILNIGWRTARMCAMETYMDCPYYEQLQYIGDTRIQAMITYYNTTDDRLARQAINAISDSRLAEGVTQGRYPALGDNIISTFSLMWIGMLHDYYLYRPDSSFVKQHLPAMRQILSFYESYTQPDGTLKNAPYWKFVDWPENAKGWKMGEPPLNPDGGSAVLDLQLLWAYQWANELEMVLGNRGLQQMYQQKAAQLVQSIRNKYWDNTQQLFADTPAKKNYSQHANTLAILTGIVEGQAAQDLFKRMMSFPNITRASIYFRYYVNQALAKVGLADEYLQQLDVWRDYLKLGMTTWGEDSNIKATRSDCHAWGASPNIEFYRMLLGIDTAAKGFAEVKIAPHLGTLKEVSGSIPHPYGTIKVSYKLDKKGRLNANITLPENLKGTFVWKNTTKELKAGNNTFIM